MFDNLYAVCLLVNDLDKSLAFYKGVLKLEVSYTDGKFASLKLGQTELALFQKDHATAMFPKEYIKPAGGFLIGFQVDDLAVCCAKLKEQGVDTFEGPKTTSWGQKVAYVHDPDQNIVEISQKETTK